MEDANASGSEPIFIKMNGMDVWPSATVWTSVVLYVYMQIYMTVTDWGSYGASTGPGMFARDVSGDP